MATKLSDRPVAVEATLLERLFTIHDVAGALGVSRRTAERMKSSGKFPRPDLYVGVSPRWRAETVKGWIESQVRDN
ncbi:helix-turn-helix transcriptional regulator [Singulisphaera sp. PoT]|uniref:helix-turn-helix transcriptional regulator n=1 Tax=Singulisphaera sp. PoT TaxID=3411797 RepID=UPI003BF4E8FD